MKCPHCNACNTGKPRATNIGSTFKKNGTFKRKSDSRIIQRFLCKRCHKSYSYALNDPAYQHNKRRINFVLKKLLASNVSCRRAAILLGVSRTTIARKLIYLGHICKQENEKFIATYNQNIECIQFDELQTIEHTKCKPLSIAVAISTATRKILGFEIAKMPATGYLARISRKKYGFRADERQEKLTKLFLKLKPVVSPFMKCYSDKHPYYQPIVSALFPKATHIQTKSDKATVIGQGELKKNQRDPLFLINHTLAMLRANINRLIRRTWCTTKDPNRLRDHLHIYMAVHNSILTS